MVNPPVEPGGYFGQQALNSGEGDFNQIEFLVSQMLGRLNTCTLVRVEAVHGTGLSTMGTVDVTPLVNQVTGDGQAIPHTTIHGLPYFRIQGGLNAIICDPKAGDIGFCVFADRDISGVKNAQGPALPGSRRRFDYSDGLYFGGWNKSAPTNYVLVDDAGIQVQTPSGLVKITGGTMEFHGPATFFDAVEFKAAVTADSTITASGEIKSGTVKLTTHKHSGVTAGGANSGPPVP